MSLRTQIALLVGLGFAAGVSLVAAGAAMAPSKRPEIWLELAKAGLQLAVVSTAGFAAAEFVRRREETRENSRRQHDSRVTLLREIIDAYNRTKGVRRTLRSHGFRAPLDGGTLGSADVQALAAQMKVLNDAQLCLERVKRELRTYSGVFRRQSEVGEKLSHIEQYVGRVLKDWSEQGRTIVEGAPRATLRALPQLQAFLDDADAGFEQGAATPMDEIQHLVSEDLSWTGGLAPVRAS